MIIEGLPPRALGLIPHYKKIEIFKRPGPILAKLWQTECMLVAEKDHYYSILPIGTIPFFSQVRKGLNRYI